MPRRTVPCNRRRTATNTDTSIPFDLPAVRCEKLTIDFNSGKLVRRSARAGGSRLRCRIGATRTGGEMFEIVAARAIAMACGIQRRSCRHGITTRGCRFKLSGC
jgi:hypothetical protein